MSDQFPPDDSQEDKASRPLLEANSASAEDVADDGFLHGAPTLELRAPSDEGKREGLMRWDEALTLEGQVEAVLFAAPKPMTVAELVELIQDEEGHPESGEIERVVHGLQRMYRERNGGFRLEHDKGVGYQFRSVPAAAPLMERMFASRQRPLSRAALETLAIIAYRQPVTRADIEYIRGVDAGSIIKNLLERELIACVGRKEDAGRPMMFGTSTEFLRVFRLPSLNDLPPLAAFQPAPELMSEAMERLDNPMDDVDVNEFMDDPEAAAPSVSEGLSASAQERLDEVTPSPVRLSDPDDEVAASAQPRRAGASYDENYEDDRDGRQEDSHTKMAVSARDRLPTRDRRDADAGSDRDQRSDLQGARDEDRSD